MTGGETKVEFLWSKNLDEQRERRWVRRPAVWGDAMEVPDMVLVADLDMIQVERMFKPID